MADPSRPHLLFVDDEESLRRPTAERLAERGFEVVEAGSGEQALELLARGATFDLLLTDLGLPGMSGEQLAAEIRRRHPGLPVVIASGYGRTASQADGVHFIGKPDPHISPIGARGIGEIGITGVAAAVANAIFNATGKRVRDLPITPDKLL